MRITKGVAALTLTAAVVAACTGGGATPSPAASAAPTAAPTSAPSEAPATPVPTPTPDACAPEDLALKTAGTLTIGADNPAYPPYFAHRDGGNTPPWEEAEYMGDPTTGMGFESRVAYAVADKLGFATDAVTWIPVAWANSFAPGSKDFDIYLTQVSYTPQRAEAVDLSDSYYHVSQSVVTLKDSPLAAAKSLTELKGATFGAQQGTTSYDAIVNVIQPTTDTQVFDNNDLAIEALKSGQIDALVVDLPTADYITNVQVEDAVVVGRFENTFDEYFSIVLEKGSALTSCVNEAIKALADEGTLDVFVSEDLPFQDTVPTLAP